MLIESISQPGVIGLRDDSSSAAGLDQPGDVVFLSAPAQTFGTIFYVTALDMLHALYPQGRIFAPHTLWASAAARRESYRRILAPVTHLYLLTDYGYRDAEGNTRGYIGADGFAEWSYLRERVREQYVWLPDGVYGRFSLRVVNPDDARRHAVVRTLGPHIPPRYVDVRPSDPSLRLGLQMRQLRRHAEGR
jgi:hypothetical protein